MTLAGDEWVADGEVVEDGELGDGVLESKKAPELFCLEEQRKYDQRNHEHAALRAKWGRMHHLLRNVRLAGSFRSYVIQGRRALATLMALWKRQRRAAASSRQLTRSAAAKFRRGNSSAFIDEGAPRHVAALLRVFELPSDLAGRVFLYYTDLVL